MTSEINKGSEFEVQLSFGKMAVKEDAEELGFRFDIGQFENIKILLVDDNLVNLMVAEQFLLKWGVEVTTANNGQFAIDSFLDEKPDLILMDLQMPVIDGIEATIEIRKMEEGDPIPIIAMTADAMIRTRDKAFSAGMTDIITKPFNPEELLKKIKNNLA